MSRRSAASAIMTDRKRYSFVLLRYRHDPAGGEFANVGVLVHQPSTGFLAAKVRTTTGPRLSKMFPHMEFGSVKRALQSVVRTTKKISDQESLLSHVGDAEHFAKRILPPDDSSLIWSEMRSGITSDPEKEIDRIFDRFVTKYDVKVKAGRDDAAVWRPVRELLNERNLADKLEPKVITSDLDQVEFSHAWKNGAWHCYQPLSFDLSSNDNIREKAARWAGHMQGLQGSDETFRPYFVVGAPSDGTLHDAYSKALALLRLSPGSPEVIEEADISRLVDLIEDEIRAHEALDRT